MLETSCISAEFGVNSSLSAADVAFAPRMRLTQPLHDRDLPPVLRYFWHPTNLWTVTEKNQKCGYGFPLKVFFPLCPFFNFFFTLLLLLFICFISFLGIYLNHCNLFPSPSQLWLLKSHFQSLEPNLPRGACRWPPQGCSLVLLSQPLPRDGQKGHWEQRRVLAEMSIFRYTITCIYKFQIWWGQSF